MLSPDVTVFLHALLSQISISTADDSFEDTARLVGKAKRELAAQAPKPNRAARRTKGPTKKATPARKGAAKKRVPAPAK